MVYTYIYNDQKGFDMNRGEWHLNNVLNFTLSFFSVYETRYCRKMSVSTFTFKYVVFLCYKDYTTASFNKPFAHH